MPFVDHDMTHLIRSDPRAASEKIAAAYRAAKCSQKDAAARLGTTAETLIRWIKRIDAARVPGGKLSARLAKIKAEAARDGWHHDNYRRGGRPPKARAEA